MEKRNAYFRASFKAKEAGDGKKTIDGYFVVYGQETELWDGFYEEINIGACAASLKNNDIRALFNHNDDIVLGRKSAKTLILREDEKGVFASVEINEEDSEALNVYARVKRGDITGCSFGFYPINEKIEKRTEGGQKNYVSEADVLEISICPFPAYPQTQIAARKRSYELSAKELLNKRKHELKERYKKNG